MTKRKPPKILRLRLSTNDQDEANVEVINQVPIDATTKNAIVIPHTRISGHPAGSSRWRDCSVAQQLMPARTM